GGARLVIFTSRPYRHSHGVDSLRPCLDLRPTSTDARPATVRSDHHHASSFWTAPSLCADMIFGNDTSSVFLATEVTKEGVEGGREEKAETGHAQHPEQHRCAQRLPHFRACSGRNGEWGNAKNE